MVDLGSVQRSGELYSRKREYQIWYECPSALPFTLALLDRLRLGTCLCQAHHTVLWATLMAEVDVAEPSVSGSGYTNVAAPIQVGLSE